MSRVLRSDGTHVCFANIGASERSICMPMGVIAKGTPSKFTKEASYPVNQMVHLHELALVDFIAAALRVDTRLGK